MKVKIENIVQLGIQGEVQLVLKELGKLHPEKTSEFITELQTENKDFINDFYVLLSDNQKKEWNWLVSAERERKYLLSKEKLTEQDMMYLKCCDF